MAEPNARNVSAMKPLATGGVLVAPYDPDDTSYLPPETQPEGSVEISEKFIALGYMDQDDNVSNAEEVESSDMYAWGGTQVGSVRTTRKETYSFKAIEQGVDAWMLRYGSDNVIGDTANGVVIHDGASYEEEHSVIIAEKLGDGRVHLGVIPRAKLSATGEVSHSDSAALGYPMTFNALSYSGDKTSYDVYYTPEDAETTTTTTTTTGE